MFEGRFLDALEAPHRIGRNNFRPTVLHLHALTGTCSDTVCTHLPTTGTN